MSALRKNLSTGACCAGLTLLSACAHYSALPLPQTAALAPSAAELPVPPQVDAPLSVEQVVALALADNPDLKALRARRGVAAGQVKQAALLPNPSLSAALLPLLSGAGTVTGWNFGMSQDIKALVTYKSRHRAVLDSEGQVAADVVWQEWQVTGKARQLAGDIVMGERLRPLVEEYVRLLADRNARMEKALAARTVTLTTIAPDRVALQSARTALDTLDQNQLSLRHQLNALLGLRPDADLPLSGQIDLPPFHPADIEAQLGDLPRRRPDLLALRLGYAAADESVRQAVLSQFPDLVFGGSVGSDNSRVVSGGPNVTVGLPIFDHGQGGIAIASATRAQLHAEYAARLAATTGEVAAMVSEGEQLASQIAVARRDLDPLRAAAERARTAFGESHLDERTYLDLVANRFAREQEIMTMEVALLDRQIAIQTLIGAGLPTVDLPAEPAGVTP
ncbi:TolC family protein [Novosphingobium clariflavum]|uniref:TolC family protein n=1 Tax=Novosphingobium clariflavum TaxID=2029884 RepID=A0ABV6SAT9_9SPHN|nr:TolC family protein [Novosphingobium clariflavum]